MQQQITSTVENKNFIYQGIFKTERGQEIKNLKINYSVSGKLNDKKDNTVWICHGLTANSDAESWWPGMVGLGCIYNPEEYYIVCANIIGSCYGSSGPTEINPDTNQPYFLDFPAVTIRDTVAAHDLLRIELGIETIHSCLGASLGGQQALEWAIMKPDLIRNLILMATNAFHSAHGIAYNEAQRMAIKADPTWNEKNLEAGKNGMAAARAIALLSYRSYETYDIKQKEDDCEKMDNFKAISYQQYQGEKFVKRFNCHSYLAITYALDSHNVGRARGGVEKALAIIKSKTLLVSISSDVLFPPHEQKFLQEHIKGASYSMIDSVYGHDGFLIETERITDILKEFYNK